MSSNVYVDTVYLALPYHAVLLYHLRGLKKLYNLNTYVIQLPGR